MLGNPFGNELGNAAEGFGNFASNVGEAAGEDDAGEDGEDHVEHEQLLKKNKNVNILIDYSNRVPI